MNKLRQIFGVASATLSLLGLNSTVLLSPASANEQPECFMLEQSGKLVDLTSLCNSTKKQPKAGASYSAAVERSTSQKSSLPVLPSISPISSVNSINSTESAPIVFASTTPVAYINTPSSSTVYASPTLYVRRFQQSGFITSDPLTRLRPFLNILETEEPLVVIIRYE
jgi:hypothetical protein